MKKLCVIGSINMDLVARVERFPKPGETIIGESFGSYPGGKGANQAVAAARLGADVLMVGRLGDDLYGSRYLDLFGREGVRTEGVSVVHEASTGVAVIEVERSSENHIVIIPGANASVTPEAIESLWPLMSDCDIFLLQLEIPLPSVEAACALLRAKGRTLILDPAPAAPLSSAVLRAVDFLTPNEHELASLSGSRAAGGEAISDGIRALRERGASTIVVKAGRAGAYLGDSSGIFHIPGYEVPVVDTTAAGDSFNAGFACALAEGRGIREAIGFANAVGALSTTGMGAQAAMPTREAVHSFVRAHVPA